MALELWLRLAVFIGLLSLLGVLETWRPIRTPARWPRWRDNLGLMLLNSVLLRLATPLSLVGAAFYAQRAGLGLFNLVELRLAVAFVLSVLVLDLAVYWQHRWMHMFAPLWRLHRVHHTDAMLDVTTGVRFHPGEILFSAAYKAMVVVALGAPPAAVVLFEVLLSGFALLTHANLRLAPWLDTMLRRLFVTPDMHWIHHGVVPAAHQRNFGFFLSCWDRWFRTYLDRAAQPVASLPLGLAGFEQTAAGLGGLLRQPLLPDATSAETSLDR